MPTLIGKSPDCACGKPCAKITTEKTEPAAQARVCGSPLLALRALFLLNPLDACLVSEYTLTKMSRDDAFMKTAAKLSSEERRAAIIKAVRCVFAEKGFHGTTTRELADASHVS